MHKDEAKCIGFREALEESRARREAKPQPWFARKLAVGIVIAIWIYAYYVYVGRFVFEMIRPHRSSKALGTRAEGIGLLVAFNLLWLMFGWCYFATIFTSPGYAEHVCPF
jgi:palmitoyltransferase